MQQRHFSPGLNGDAPPGFRQQPEIVDEIDAILRVCCAQGRVRSIENMCGGRQICRRKEWIAVFIVIVTGTVLPGIDIDSASQAAAELMKTDRYVGAFLAIGLFDAGLLGAICISLASSWAFGEIFGWAHSLNTKIRQAPWFYATYFLMLASSGLVVLIPHAPLVLITLFVQVIAVTLLPAALVFLILLLNDRAAVGEYCNTAVQNLVGGCIVVLIVVLSTLYGITVMFPNLIH